MGEKYPLARGGCLPVGSTPRGPPTRVTSRLVGSRTGTEDRAAKGANGSSHGQLKEERWDEVWKETGCGGRPAAAASTILTTSSSHDIYTIRLDSIFLGSLEVARWGHARFWRGDTTTWEEPRWKGCIDDCCITVLATRACV